MTRIRLGLICGAAALASLVSFACPVFHPVTPTPPDGGFADASANTTFVDCSETALHAAALKILPSVETGLAIGNIPGALAAAGINIGAPFVIDEVACAVAWVVAKLENGPAELRADSINAKKIANGKAWLAAHPVTFVGDSGSP